MIGLNENGVLPVGIHNLSLNEIESLFGRFQKSDRRLILFSRLKKLVNQLESFDFVKYLIVDGSYITSKPSPEDIDLIVVVEPGIINQTWTPLEYNVLSSRRLRKHYKFDCFVVPEGSSALNKYISFFSRCKEENPDLKKGLIKLQV
jgi:hypothetical protein